LAFFFLECAHALEQLDRVPVVDLFLFVERGPDRAV